MLHRNIEELDPKIFGGKSFDLIFMGQVIEHIHKEKLDSVLQTIKRLLKNKGRFIFDTPNRLITKIQSPSAYIDKDHKYEYSPDKIEILFKSERI